MSGAKKLRGRQTILPDWWQIELLAAIRLFKLATEESGQRWSLQYLGDQLATRANRRLNGRLVSWDRKTVERFIDGDNPTEELLDAFRLLFPHLVRPTFVARSRAEALDLLVTSQR